MTPSSNRDDPSVRPQKRPASPELDTLSSATSTPAKKAKINTTAGKTSKKPSPSPSTGTEAKISKGESWGAERRLRLWGAFNACAEIRWEDVAAMMGEGVTAKMCREQWQRGTGKRITKALQED